MCVFIVGLTGVKHFRCLRRQHNETSNPYPNICAYSAAGSASFLMLIKKWLVEFFFFDVYVHLFITIL
jgi:hypothetical protein